MIDLTPFVADHDTKYCMRQQFVVDGYRYAVNGHLAVRVPDDGPNTEVLAGDVPFPPMNFVFRPAVGDRRPWPERLYCPQCFDVGTIGCRGCRGRSDDGCDGCGVRRCRLCNGRPPSGQLAEDSGVRWCLDVGKHWVDAKYDDLIRELPDVTFVLIDDPSHPLPFFFTGGEGRVMGVRREVIR